MNVDVSLLDESKLVDVAKSTEPSAAASSVEHSDAVLTAVEKFKGLGLKRRTLPATRPDGPSVHHPLTNDPASDNSQQHHQHSYDGDNRGSLDNPFDFDFKRLKFLRRSLDSRSTPVVHSPSTSTPPPLSEDDRRMMQLKSVFNKLFKRKKDKKEKGIDQTVMEAEDYQVWKNVAPLVFNPSAVFMGLSFMIEDKGSTLSGGMSMDWNMNVILALVKVNILPYTFTSKDTKVKSRESTRLSTRFEKTPLHSLSPKEKEEREAKEQKRFMVIWVQYGDYLPSWQIERSLDDFAHLYEAYHHQIPEYSLLTATQKLPKPPAILRSRFGIGSWAATMNDGHDGHDNHDGHDASLNEEDTGDGSIPIEDAFDPKGAKKLTSELQTFLQEMIQYAIYLPRAERMCKFLELSALTLALGRDGGYQGKEGYLTVVKQKRLMDEGPLANAVKKVIRKPISKYFVVRDSFIIVAASHKNTEIQDVILLDSSFKANKCPRHIHTPHSFDIINSELKLHVRAKSDHRRRQFIGSIRKMPPLWREPKRFNSFAPVRKNVSAQWLVDGRDYFWNASKAMEMAKETIYILDWMLSPEVLLRRLQRDGVDWSLKDVLERKAKEGVKVYIVMYSEVEAAMHLASLRAKKLLRKLCPENIWVQRHGPNLKTAWWAHHEKLVVVDNMIAFIGGLDLSFGRWDTAEHTLVDFDEDGLGHRWPGQDYSNPRIKDFCDLSKPVNDNLDRSENPRMPWHDVGLQILGQPARDVGRHFIQRWNFLCRTKPKQKRIPFLLPKPDLHLSKLKEMGLEGTCEIQILRSVSSWSMGLKEPECSILTAYIAAIERAEHFIYI
ncbi:Phospholipase D1, partial [Modicella reniformis]